MLKVTAEVGCTWAFFTVQVDDCRPEHGVTIRGLVLRYHLTDAETEQVRKLKFNDSVVLRSPFETPHQRFVRVVNELNPRINEAIRRIEHGGTLVYEPVSRTDPDVVLAECQNALVYARDQLLMRGL